MSKKQLNLNIFRGKRGGRRPGAGRKRLHSKGVAHRVREVISQRTPMHINFRFRTTVRNKDSLRLLKRAIVNARAMGLVVVHFSLQTNHIHLIVEANSNELLTRGMRSLTITFAKGLKKGKVQLGRYHLHVLKSIRETRNAILYVLFNQQKHEHRKLSTIDEYSSLLLMEKGLEIIRKFVSSAGITLKLTKSDSWRLEKGQSYLLQKSLEAIC